MNAMIDNTQTVNTAEETIRLIMRAAPDVASMRFVWLAISVYFERVIDASETKLTEFGLRPIAAPIAAELALDRAAHARSFRDFLETLIGGDDLIADLAIRAVRLYARRFAVMANPAISTELAADLHIDMNATACAVWRNLQFIDPAASGEGVA